MRVARDAVNHPFAGRFVVADVGRLRKDDGKVRILTNPATVVQGFASQENQSPIDFRVAVCQTQRIVRHPVAGEVKRVQALQSFRTVFDRTPVDRSRRSLADRIGKRKNPCSFKIDLGTRDNYGP